MENNIAADKAGTVNEIKVAPGDIRRLRRRRRRHRVAVVIEEPLSRAVSGGPCPPGPPRACGAARRTRRRAGRAPRRPSATATAPWPGWSRTASSGAPACRPARTSDTAARHEVDARRATRGAACPRRPKQPQRAEHRARCAAAVEHEAGERQRSSTATQHPERQRRRRRWPATPRASSTAAAGPHEPGGEAGSRSARRAHRPSWRGSSTFCAPASASSAAATSAGPVSAGTVRSLGRVGERLGQRRVHEQAVDDVGDPQAVGDRDRDAPR